MRQLTYELVRNIHRLRGTGLAYKKIAKFLNTSSANTYKYSKHIVLSRQKLNQLNSNMVANWGKFASVYSVPKDILLPKIDEDFIFVLGHLFFDGSVFMRKSGQCGLNYTNSSIELIDEFILKGKNCFGINNSKVQKFKGINLDWYQTIFYSVKAYDFVYTLSPMFSTAKGARVPGFVFSLDEKLIAIFLQTFWDDEGCASSHISGFSKSEKMIDDLIRLHETLGINCIKGKSGGCFRLTLRCHYNNLMKFAAKVNFSKSIVTKGKHIGRYKKDVLKEIILSKVPR